MPSFRELLADAKSHITEVDPATAEAKLRDDDALVLDVREPDEHGQGAIEGALHIPRGQLEASIEGRLPDHDRPIVVHCASGVRSAFAAATLGELGYTDVVSMTGGFNRWKDEGRAWSVPEALTAEQRNRYQRHLLLPEVGDAGQLDLLGSKVLLLGADNVVELFSQYDLVVDGTDNFPTRFLVNDASLKTRTPVVHGSIFRFEGQASTYLPYVGPCYRCQVPEPPPAELAPSCAEAGVLGVLPGIVGSLQAMETIKLVLDLGDPLVGRLLAYDALEESFRTFKVLRDPDCPACSHPPEDIVIAEYDELCMPHPMPALVTA